jgi:hypothetical protein
MTKFDAQWVVGFVDGEGCFYVGVNRNPKLRFGYQIQAEFVVVQHIRDIQVLEGLRHQFGCGQVVVNHGDRYAWRVRDLQHLIEIIIPFFEKHQFHTKKKIEFQRFRNICLKMNDGLHLTEEGFKEIAALAKSLRFK